MATRRIKLMSIATVGVLGASAWFIYSIMAAQGQGALAQAPLNNQVQVPPAFIMALDDSGSMVWETLNNTRDGVYSWRDNSKSFFFDDGSPRGYSDGNQRYYYTFPPYGRGENAIPPIDAFGFARSPDVNPGYFDPRNTYPTWKKEDGSDYMVINPSQAPVDPRPNGSPGKSTATLNLTETSENYDSGWRYRVREGMRLPAGLRVRGYCDAEPNDISSWNFTALPGVREIDETCDIGISYYPATFFLEDPGSLPDSYGYVATPLAITAPSGGGPGTLYKYEIRPDNFSSAAAYGNAIQNFANWFSFYRTRREALIGGSTNALASVNNMSVGWFRINNRTDVAMRDMSDQVEKADLFGEIYRMGASGSTPTRRAVRHMGEQFKRTGDGAPVQLTCQKNAGMLFTDGYINDSSSPNVGGNIDGTRMPMAPFEDGVSNTMADIVVPYYLDSLRPDIEQNAVPVPAACKLDNPDPRLDCQTSLHMNFYGVSLGTSGEMYEVSYIPSPEDPLRVTPDPFDAPPSWHSSREDLSPHAVDEMWHATINARGGMINAKRPADIITAMRRILQSVSSGASPSGTLAVTGSRINTRSLVVQPSYEIRNEGTDWFSKLAAFKLDINPLTRVVTETQIWEASDKLASQSYTSRRDHTWYGTGSGAAQISGVTLNMLCNNTLPSMSRCTAGDITSRLGVTAAQAVNYLVGDVTQEVRNPGGVLRNRTTLLGDIINSTPVVSAPTDDYGYRSLGTVGSVNYGTTYNTYMESKESRSAMVYVGANDGMLHAFHGGINAAGDVDSGNGGRELFAYIPRAVLGHMGNLLYPYVAADENDQKFSHRYFVDGPIAVSDAYYSGGWKTVLVGTTGAGGRSVFALNVSNPGGFGASSRLWEIDDQNGSTTVANNIGHVLGKPVIVPVKESSGAVAWKAIFGNGYNSRDGKAVLFVVDIASGAVRMIEAVESGAPAGSNGLGNIAVVDRWAPPVGDPSGAPTRPARDGFGDTVYAADQKGAIWRFDLRSSAAQITTPLFTTQTHTEDGDQYRQPITGGLAVTAGRGGGVMLLFGTGSFSFVSDSADNSVQTIYGVLDSGFAGTRTRADLASRSSATAPGGTARTVTGGGNSAAGWYLDLPAGERAVGYPRVASGVLFIPTYAPDVVDGCSTSGMNWLYGLNTRTGTAALSSVRFGSPSGDTQGEGVGAVALETLGTAPIKDVGITVLSRAAPPNPGETPPPDDGCWMRITVPGMDDEMFVPYPCGRQSWRQLQ